jgi:hypothetical protein
MALVLINSPHAARVLRDHFGFIPNIDFVAGDNGDNKTAIDWLSGTAMPAVSEIEAITEMQLGATSATRAAQQAKAAATSSVDKGAAIEGDKTERIIRALVDLILDEFNAHSTMEAAMFTAVADATSLADLKTRYAAITPVPQRTLAGLVTAIKAQIAATPE